MTHNRLLLTGIVGFVVSMLGCLTSVLVVLLAAIGAAPSWRPLRSRQRRLLRCREES
jgi:hypothetical protein